MLIRAIFRLHTGGLGAQTPASTQQRRPAVEERRARAQHFSRFARYSGIIKRTTRRRSRQTNGGARRWTIRKDSTITSFKMALSQHTARKPGWCALWPFRLSERGLKPTEHLDPCTKEDARPPHPRERSRAARCMAPGPKKVACPEAILSDMGGCEYVISFDAQTAA